MIFDDVMLKGHFHYFPHAMEIFRKRAELKKSPGAALEHEQRGLSGGPNVPVCTAIRQDFPTSISNTCNQSKQVLKVGKKCEKGVFLKARVKGSTYSLQQCYNVQELDIHSTGKVKRPTAALFHGNFNPFSNFFPCSCSQNGIQYHCVEQLYQKAIHANKGLVATKILHAEDPVDMKHLGDSVDGSNWSNTTAIVTMMIGLSDSFYPNC